MPLTQIFIDGTLKSEVKFNVSGLDVSFAKELSKTQIIQDFPAPGKSVTVKWSEADQNFIIVDQD